MSSRIYRASMMLVTLAMVLSLLAAKTSAQHPETTISEYFDLLRSGNFESASYMWRESSLARSTRFGIEFEGIPLKTDCGSPILRNLELMKYHLEPPVRRKTKLDDTPDCFRMDFENIVNGEKVSHGNYLIFENGYYWFTYPQDCYCADWAVVESKYLRIHFETSVERFLTPFALTAADNLLKELADSVGLKKDDLKLIKEKKIEYFYCSSDEQVQKITGHLIKGTLDLGSNDIISSYFPHAHELAHLLVNIKLKKLPLYTLPILREGYAVDLGGRWGKMPAPLRELGSYLLNFDILDIDSILTMRGFEVNAGSDIAYPIAGLFCSYLKDKIGLEKFDALYWASSGSFEQLTSLDETAVKNIFLIATEIPDWDSLIVDFYQYAEEVVIANSQLVPGVIDGGKKLIETSQLIVTQKNNWIQFECFAPIGSPLAGNLLFDHKNELTSGASLLFDEQYNGEFEFEGYRFGVRYDQNEVGLYDYGNNHLVAKYIWGISPSEDYYSEKTNRLTFRLKKELLDKKPSDKNYKFLIH